MDKIFYRVTLTQEERLSLVTLTKTGKHSSRKVVHGLILLNSDTCTVYEVRGSGEFADGTKRTNKDVADFLQINERTVERIKKRFVEEGLESALEDKPSDREYTRKADGDFEARLISLSCSQPPEGFSRWSLRLLSDKVVELEYVDSISYETVRRTLKKTN